MVCTYDKTYEMPETWVQAERLTSILVDLNSKIWETIVLKGSCTEYFSGQKPSYEWY